MRSSNSFDNCLLISYKLFLPRVNGSSIQSISKVLDSVTFDSWSYSKIPLLNIFEVGKKNSTRQTFSIGGNRWLVPCILSPDSTSARVSFRNIEEIVACQFKQAESNQRDYFFE